MSKSPIFWVFAKTLGPKTANFLVVYGDNVTAGGSIFGTKRAIDKRKMVFQVRTSEGPIHS